MVTITKATSAIAPQAAVSGKDAGCTHPQRIGAREKRLTARAINPSAAGLAQESGDCSVLCCTIQNLLDIETMLIPRIIVRLSVPVKRV